MKKLAKAIRKDGWDRRLEDAVSLMSSCLPTDVVLCDVAAVCDAIKAMLSIAVKPKGRDGKEFLESLKLEPVNRFAARRGDVGVFFFEGRYLAGVVSSAGFVVRMPHGVSIFSITDIEQAYKIGA
ncbi:hypothetical protein GGQ73_000635 [Rhizobium skierniewicense]|uniref:DUF6950 domain-containing protein n=1 Tax=Rhizobium skierniewicense TaxID=984260 RepID=A0A7W6C2V1_9HYPH|nr:hypothetical protein [Rhizobium skierniewicense]MBB3944710.1 hypothetical protein [Rhizobium skierniewicense]